MPKLLTTYDVAHTSTPSTPQSGYSKMYFKADGFLYRLNSSGVETRINDETFESFSKNLRTYPNTLNYTSGVLTSIVYNTGVSFITKTLNYTSGILTSIVLSGAIPSGIPTTKTLTYTSGVLTGITYS